MDKQAKATFAGGCFWCMQPVFDAVEGVLSTAVGYMGGHKSHPTYEEVCEGDTGHAEVIQIIYDPRKVSYQKLLDIFWRNIDPTTPDQQFCDIGHQYRSAIFYHDDTQKILAEQSKETLVRSHKFGGIATEIVAAMQFYPAEDSHQNYYKTQSHRYKTYHDLSNREKRLKELWSQDAGPGRSGRTQDQDLHDNRPLA